MLDLAIIGGGPAGLSAGLYATRGGLKNVVMFEKGMPGGQIMLSSEIENYPGVTEVVSGMDFMSVWPAQCMKFGLIHRMEEVTRVLKEGDFFKIALSGGEIVEAKSVIICTGSSAKKAGFAGEEKFLGRGVSTCATCDGFFYKNKEVAVLGGGDTALEEALYLSKICSKVYLVHRRDKFRASPATVERLNKAQNIEQVLNVSVKEVLGDNMGVCGVLVEDSNANLREIKVLGVFVFVGMNVNNSVLLQEDGNYICTLNKAGEVVVDHKMKTSTSGLFAAGDMRSEAARQVVCAAADGAVAALSAINYIETLEH